MGLTRDANDVAELARGSVSSEGSKRAAEVGNFIGRPFRPVSRRNFRTKPLSGHQESSSEEQPVEATSAVNGRPAAEVLAGGYSADSSLAVKGIYPKFAKRLVDLFIAVGAILVLSPLLILTALVVRVKLGQGVIYRQRRIGFKGETFEMFKFRTMKEDRRRSVIRSRPGPDRRISHKRDDDPRHTPLGRFLRRYSIDELPQLLNVIRGEMSIVGPRPEMETVVEKIGARGHDRHLVRPGITGLWQVSTRQDGDLLIEAFDEDLIYVAQVSFRGDVDIVRRTFAVIFAGSGR
ncbi:MAG TPA: sugar transferase [Microthrixaceae bacterium]|nr:sugar transferase [Microthrixaceae bacterium]